MKRTLSLLTILALALPLLAEERQRYTITTKDEPRAALLRITANAQGADERRVRTFRNLDGFAAELTAEEAAALRETPGVLSVDPAVPRYASLAGWDKQVMPWGVPTVNAANVWPVTKGEGVNVVVIDTGIDLQHPDLKAAYAGGVNIVNSEKPPADDNTHGTHVTGIIAATNNEFGVVGVAPGVRLWAAKALDWEGKGDDIWTAAALDWAMTKQRELGGRWVVNMSLGAAVKGGKLEQQAVERALQAGLILVAAAGNRNWQHLDYPANYPGVIAVGAVDQEGKKAEFSSWGLNMPVVAPGVLVPSTLRDGFLEGSDVVIGKDVITSLGVIGSPKKQITGRMIYCGLGYPEQIPMAVNGRIALIQRGELEFREKARNAKNAGAIAVIIYDNVPDAPLRPWTMIPCSSGVCGGEWKDYQFPLTVGVSYQDGLKLRERIAEEVVVSFEYHRYGPLSGTSMATPHVTAVAALMLSLDPSLRASEIARILKLTARDTAEPGWDFETGWGIVDALAAAKYVAPDKFNVPPPPASPGKRRSARH